MANWYGSARSNYFRVKDANAFHEWTERRQLEVFKSDKEADVVAIHPSENSDGAWPSYDLEEDAEFELATGTCRTPRSRSGGRVARSRSREATLSDRTGDCRECRRAHVVELTLSDIYREAARAFRVPESEIKRAEY